MFLCRTRLEIGEEVVLLVNMERVKGRRIFIQARLDIEGGQMIPPTYNTFLSSLNLFFIILKNLQSNNRYKIFILYYSFFYFGLRVRVCLLGPKRAHAEKKIRVVSSMWAKEYAGRGKETPSRERRSEFNYLCLCLAFFLSLFFIIILFFYFILYLSLLVSNAAFEKPQL